MIFNWQDFIAGWFGGCAGLIVGHPLDTVKVRQQILDTTIFNALRKTYKYEGFRGFYKGMLFPLVTTGPSNSIFFGVYANCMRISQKDNKTGDRVLYTDPNWKQKVFWAGCFAGCVQVLATSPVELVKTILQVQTQNKAVWKTEYESAYTGMWDCLKWVYKESGIKGLYRGVVPMLFRDIPTSGLYTLTYEMLMVYEYPLDKMNNKLFKQILAGGSAGIISWVLVLPFDVVKSRIQADNPNNPKYTNMVDCFYKSYKAEGYKVFTKGSLAVCARAFPANAAIFVGYEYVLSAFKRYT